MYVHLSNRTLVALHQPAIEELTPEVFSETQTNSQATPANLALVRGVLQPTIYALALAVSVSIWFIAIHAPLWLDETISFFIIKKGFFQILSRQGWPGVPAYSYLLWLWTRALGTGEVTLRLLSVLAMLGAVYLLYHTARELFDQDVAIIAAVVFCLHPIVVSESIDIRPYAFGALAITSSIFALVRLRRSDSYWLAALFGLSAACIVYFQFLFVVILPALVICFFVVKAGDGKRLWQQFGVAVAMFALAFLPVIPGLLYLFHTSGIHVFAETPTFAELRQTVAGRQPTLLLAGTLLLAALTKRLTWRRRSAGRAFLFCASLALIPLFILYGVSVRTSIHIFVLRYRLIAIPGIALCWAFVVSYIHSRTLRLLFCVALVGLASYSYYRSPIAKNHNYSWKYALEFADKNASLDNAPVLICSDLPESDYLPLPTGAAVKGSALFAPLSYYPVRATVVPLPRGLNKNMMQAASQFLEHATHRRFLAMGYMASYEAMDWITDSTDATHDMHELGVFDGVEVLEYVPHSAEVAR
jgi:hypothetical protein